MIRFGRYGPRSLTIGKWHVVVYTFFNKDKPGQRIWIDATFGGDWYTFIWWKKTRPVLYRSSDATPPTKSNRGKYFFGSERDLLL